MFHQLSPRQQFLYRQGPKSLHPDLVELVKHEGDVSTCEDCGDAFLPRRSDQTRCVKNCRGRGRYGYKRCVECGDYFHANDWRRKTCDDCRTTRVPESGKFHLELCNAIIGEAWDVFFTYYNGLEPVHPRHLFRVWLSDDPMSAFVVRGRWNLFLRKREKSWKRFDKREYAKQDFGQARMIANNLERLFGSDFKVTQQEIDRVLSTRPVAECD